ncbi:terpenoid synthase [Fistulina hepatica ATCC 64428]|uniref:Terpenoid synthase n=1 Tax=Fistulina hepatica ATCC 64428 TaxID=1128425 RepID=A0A0D6ZZ79_9AGAR|nr:terpenoid synthase [Fistulina hepatica ATCC 64428]
MFYIDDIAPKHPEVFEVFEYRMIHHLPQLDPVLTAFIAALKRMWDIYDMESARTIFGACVQFVTISCMEPNIPRIEHAPHCSSKFPWFIRQRSGLGLAFACFTFPKRLQIPHMTYLQVLPDMDFILCAINDLFSFYKEEMDGEDFNFVHLRARAENKSPMQVVADMSSELQDAHCTVHAALGSFPQALKCWANVERGFVVSHLAQGRYRLGELGVHL